MVKEEDKFLESYFKNAKKLKTIKPDYYYRVDFSELTMETYIAGKNELLNSLADPKIFNYINKVLRHINDPKSKIGIRCNELSQKLIEERTKKT